MSSCMLCSLTILQINKDDALYYTGWRTSSLNWNALHNCMPFSHKIWSIQKKNDHHDHFDVIGENKITQEAHHKKQQLQ